MTDMVSPHTNPPVSLPGFLRATQVSPPVRSKPHHPLIPGRSVFAYRKYRASFRIESAVFRTKDEVRKVSVEASTSSLERRKPSQTGHGWMRSPSAEGQMQT